MNKCFVIMPFKGLINGYYKDIYKPAIEAEGLKPFRADEYFGGRPIISDILNAILSSEIILADLTNKNPNVNYELGIAHSLGKPTILVAQNLKDLPFDYQHIRVHFYNTSSSHWQSELSNYIRSSIKAIKENPTRFSLLNQEINSDKVLAIEKLEEISNLQDTKIERDYEMVFDEKGNCSISIVLHIETFTDFNVLKYKFFISEPGEIKVLELFDFGTGKPLNYLTIKSDDNSLTILILFDNKPPKSKFKAKVAVYAENYMSDLVKKKSSVSHHINRYSLTSSKIDRLVRYYFPINDFFKELKAFQYTKFDNNEVVESEISKIQENNYYVFSYQNRTDKPILTFNIKFYLPESN